jgi:ArsR family transcriptional regulator, arsenate/arsenite/antimonite-responsive transcriptional repressor
VEFQPGFHEGDAVYDTGRFWQTVSSGGWMECGNLHSQLPLRSGQVLTHLPYFYDARNNVMKKHVEQFSALGQEDRLKIFRMLVRAGPEGNCVDDIKRRVKMPGSTLSHHLDTLTRAGLLTARRSSRFIYYAVNWRETAHLIRFLTEDCCADIHTKLTASSASAAPQVRAGRTLDCCKEPAATPRTIREHTLMKRQGELKVAHRASRKRQRENHAQIANRL